MYKIPCECGKVYVGETGRCMHEWIKEDERIYGFHELKLRPFLNAPIRPGIICSGTKLSLLTEIPPGTLVELKRLFT